MIWSAEPAAMVNPAEGPPENRKPPEPADVSERVMDGIVPLYVKPKMVRLGISMLVGRLLPLPVRITLSR